MEDHALLCISSNNSTAPGLLPMLEALCTPIYISRLQQVQQSEEEKDSFSNQREPFATITEANYAQLDAVAIVKAWSKETRERVVGMYRLLLLPLPLLSLASPLPCL